MHDDNDTPIPGASLASEMARVVRYTTAAIGGYLVAKGLVDQATVELVAGIVATATPMLIGMALARLERKQVSRVISTLKSKAEKSDHETPSE